MSTEESTSERGFTLKGGPRSESEEGSLPKVDFSTFVLSLGTSALYHLGLVPEPGGNPAAAPLQPSESDVLIARQTIDTLEMLAGKTRGNLTRDEEKLLESILYELRIRYAARG